MRTLPTSGRIYALSDPRDGAVRYVGKTVKTAQERLKDHLWTRPKSMKRPLYRWVTELLCLSLCPQISVVEEVDFDELDRAEQLALIDAAERLWIARFRESGAALLNLTDGGNGSHGRIKSAEEIEKIRRANTGRKRSASTCAKLREIARARGEAHYRKGTESSGWGDPSRYDVATRNAKIAAAWQKKTPEELAIHRDRASRIWSRPDLLRAQSERHKGENNCRATITEETAKLIFSAEGSSRGLAKRFGISRNIVMSVKKQRSWKWATANLET